MWNGSARAVIDSNFSFTEANEELRAILQDPKLRKKIPNNIDAVNRDSLVDMSNGQRQLWLAMYTVLMATKERGLRVLVLDDCLSDVDGKNKETFIQFVKHIAAQKKLSIIIIAPNNTWDTLIHNRMILVEDQNSILSIAVQEDISPQQAIRVYWTILLNLTELINRKDVALAQAIAIQLQIKDNIAYYLARLNKRQSRDSNYMSMIHELDLYINSILEHISLEVSRQEGDVETISLIHDSATDHMSRIKAVNIHNETHLRMLLIGILNGIAYSSIHHKAMPLHIGSLEYTSLDDRTIYNLLQTASKLAEHQPPTFLLNMELVRPSIGNMEDFMRWLTNAKLLSLRKLRAPEEETTMNKRYQHMITLMNQILTQEIYRRTKPRTFHRRCTEKPQREVVEENTRKANTREELARLVSIAEEITQKTIALIAKQQTPKEIQELTGVFPLNLYAILNSPIFTNHTMVYIGANMRSMADFMRQQQIKNSVEQHLRDRISDTNRSPSR